MNIYIPKENKSRSTQSSPSLKRTNSANTFQFSDNRSETIMQGKLKEVANNQFDKPIQKQELEEEELLQGKFGTIQKQEFEEEELLQGRFKTIQRQELEEDESLQGKFEPIQKKGNNTGLPDNLKSGIENLSGFGMDDVKVHYNSDKPSTLQAHAYVQGTEIHVAPGQEKHLPHEAWHVVQQKQGRVKPTMQMKGNVNVNDDAGLEKEADVMGVKAIQFRSSFIEEINLTSDNLSDAGSKKSSAIQFMPSSNTVKTFLGNPHKGLQFGKGEGLSKLVPHLQSEQYRKILKLLDDFFEMGKLQIADNKHKTIAQLKRLLQLFDEIIDACGKYEGQNDHTKASYFQELKIQAQNEKGDALARMNNWANIVEGKAPGDVKNKTIHGVIAGGAMIGGKVLLNEDYYSRDVGGGTNTLNVYSYEGTEYYFKPNQAQLDVFEDDHDENRGLEETQGASEEVGKAFIAKQNRTNLSKDTGIDTKDSRSANREVASYRLDALLGGGLISRTQFALRQAEVDTPKEFGSLQAGAKGKQAGDFEAQKPTRDITDKTNVGNGAYLAKDANLARLLGRLQLLDILALQVDRNLGNYYIQLDQNEDVQNVTGIDNDVSFGTATAIDTGMNQPIYQLPGLCQYVDKEMAEKILTIDLELIDLTFSDLLKPNEIAAIKTRLDSLQVHLRNDNTNLLKPSQWTAAIVNLGVNSKTYQRILQQKAEMAPNDRNY